MNDKRLIITLFISIFFHYWLINTFSEPFKKIALLEETEVLPASVRMEFVKPRSTAMPMEEKSNSSLAENNAPLEITSAKEELKESVKEQEILEQGKLLSKKIIPKESSDTKQKVLTIEKNIDQQQVLRPENEIGNRTEEKNIKQEGQRKVDGTSTEEKDESDKENNRIDAQWDISQLKEEAEITQIEKDTPLDLTYSNPLDNQIILPEIISSNLPEYPHNLRKRNIEGQVLLKVLIDKEGRVAEIFVDISSGYQGFDQAALESVSHWIFCPAIYNDMEKESWVLIPVIFKIK
ncbi:MAG TPA: TonB family protein [Atribacterota bacterium]|nr:TonB family protein [Atribacterota bacterium]HOR42552.1 TonB family protein [Atribacterota bacterium]